MVRSGDAETLMKGSLHTDELLHEVMKKDGGLRTERRLSHCFVMAVPTYARAVIVSDAAINIMPTLEEKADIVQNAIELAHAVGVSRRWRSLRRGDGDAENPLDHRRGGAVQDGRPRPDQGRTGRRSARLR